MRIEWNKVTRFSMFVAVVLFVGIFVFGFCLGFMWGETTSQPVQVVMPAHERAIGGETDAHGCIGPAGYSWCETKQKCLRSWEEPCVTVTITPAPSPR